MGSEFNDKALENSLLHVYDLSAKELLENNMVYKLHKLFNSMPRYNFQNLHNINVNEGIYILFQHGEKYGLIDRIVGVGVNKKNETLRTNLRKESKDGDKNSSVLRYEIGKAMLNYAKSPYLREWNIKNQKEYEGYEVEERLIEEKVSLYINEKMSFTYFGVIDNNEMDGLKDRIMNTLFYDKNFVDSDKFAASYSPNDLVRESGIWTIEKAEREFITEKDFYYIEKECNKVKSLEKLMHSKSLIISSNEDGIMKNKKDEEKKNIEKFITEKLEKAKGNNEKYTDLVSGEVNGELGYAKHKIYKVCQVMMDMRSEEDKVLHTTPSNISSNLKIRYFLE